jgi:LysM repeat protein/ABC-type branched-subunit amino acid transport system substrate-binding protein
MKSFRILFAFALCMGAQGMAHAQEVRTVDGRKYTVHRVEAGQTLYAIARSKAVPVEVLLAVNPGAQDGLSIGEEVLLPLDAVQKKELRSAPVLSATGGLQHSVKKKETLFGIARSYGVDVNALAAANPQAQNGLQEGMVLTIPVAEIKGQQPVSLSPAQPERLVDHTVVAGETLYGLAQRYGTTPEAIQRANGGLSAGPQVGQVIRVPVRPGFEPVAAPIVPTTPARTADRYQVTFLLPFAVPRNDSVLAATPVGEAERFHSTSRMAAQFYAGALLALDSLRAGAAQLDVKVFDSGETASVWGGVIKQQELAETDLFIGPFHRAAIEQVARTYPDAHVVCPVPQSNKVILGMPNVSKVTPSRSELLRHAARYVVQRHAAENIVHLRPDIAADKEGQDQMGRALNEALASNSMRLRDTVLVAKPGRRDHTDLIAKLDAKRLNVIVTTCEDVEFATSLVGKLKSLVTKYRIAFVGTEALLGMETISASDLDLIGFLFPAATYTDRTDARDQAFVSAFQERFRTDADEYAYLGFDVTYQYLKALMDRGSELVAGLPEVDPKPLHMGFRMSRTGPENGYRNEYAIMLQQQDLQLVKAP